MVEIEPLGTTILLPAFVLGFELPEDQTVHERLQRWRDSPDWIALYMQQAGGMAMFYPCVAGATLRFSDNVDRIREAAFVIRGFQAMAEDPDYAVLARDYPALRRLTGTWGKACNSQELHSLQQFLGRFVDTPAVESGYEAFVRFAPCDLLHYFLEWRMLQIHVGSQMREIYRDQPCPVLEPGNFCDTQLSSDLVFNSNRLRDLDALGELIGQSQPRLFLLWENCD